ncbi:hypothetical protein BKA63DRAFT_566604 [Paraphoma chrysanthemicola]|nr:hypothetical protein BKA63DRAFT_566604 [Paraphoma chrysanthemicola]
MFSEANPILADCTIDPQLHLNRAWHVLRYVKYHLDTQSLSTQDQAAYSEPPVSAASSHEPILSTPSSSDARLGSPSTSQGEDRDPNCPPKPPSSMRQSCLNAFFPTEYIRLAPRRAALAHSAVGIVVSDDEIIDSRTSALRLASTQSNNSSVIKVALDSLETRSRVATDSNSLAAFANQDYNDVLLQATSSVAWDLLLDPDLVLNLIHCAQFSS